MRRAALLFLLLAACDGGPAPAPAPGPATATTAAAGGAGGYVQRWTLNASDARPAGGCGVFADLPASAPDCSSVAPSRQGPGGECSVGCFGAAGDVRVAVACAACDAEYTVTFVTQ